MFLLAIPLIGPISLANLVCRGTLGSKPSTGFMILAGSGMLRLRPSFETPEASDFANPWKVADIAEELRRTRSSDKFGMVMRLRQRHVG
jgi:hypothetical protein